MTDETIWNTKSISFAEISQETEATLELESWMTSTETWNLNNSYVEESEAGMELESWMTSEDTWNSFGNIQETETELTIENWMTNENNWNR